MARDPGTRFEHYALHDYINAVRGLPLDQKQQDAMLSGTAAEPLKFG